MSYQEKRSIVYLITSVLIFGGYGLYVLGLAQADRLESSNWGRVILALVVIHIGINIVVEIVFAILSAIITREEQPPLTDERDRSIDLRATNNSFLVFGMGFLVAMGTVAVEMPLYVMFNTLVYGFFFAELMWSSTQLYFYRRGF